MNNRNVSTVSSDRENKVRRDPLIALNNVTNSKECHGGRRLMYAENSMGACSFLQDHGGVQVYVLTNGTFQECIVSGHVGEFEEDGLYKLRGT